MIKIEQEIFDEIKEKSIEIWKTYDDTFGYSTEKIKRVQEIKNIGYNLYCIVGMFDVFNRTKLYLKLSKKSRKILSKFIIN